MDNARDKSLPDPSLTRTCSGTSAGVFLLRIEASSPREESKEPRMSLSATIGQQPLYRNSGHLQGTGTHLEQKSPARAGAKGVPTGPIPSDGKGDATIQTIDVFKIDENSEGLLRGATAPSTG
jgi:hypothetical protein